MRQTLLLLALLLGLAACGPLQPASGPPTYNRDIGGHSGGA
jgi:predicted small lipoprotein YifL